MILVWVSWNFVGLILGLRLILVWVWLLGSTEREREIGERKRPVVGSKERHTEEKKKKIEEEREERINK